MKIVDIHNGFKTGQIVLEQNQLSRIVYIEIDDDLSEKFNRDIHYVRLGHINPKTGIETSNSTTSTEFLIPISLVQQENGNILIVKNQ